MADQNKIDCEINFRGPGLRIVIVGRGETRGRRPHLLRLRESVYQELKQYADGQTYLLVELALRKMIDELKRRPISEVEIIQAHDFDATPEDIRLLALNRGSADN
ncbi:MULTISPECIES: hypothetical protein [Comamonas]|jgi:hypothetical protein|uniref:hypothetical protein n=1 Tax=Comamonas TaxID=283 RepID=UPI00103FC39E|nr:MULTISPECIES: hypothetical protein [Comamonas]TYK71192.1 hypothetical protein FSY45_23645 [Comamonas sp. Z1]TZG08314.1 hypothetical protein FZC30_17100 [Comamonas thiooxydans]